jgi:hypothetical protein
MVLCPPSMRMAVTSPSDWQIMMAGANTPVIPPKNGDKHEGSQWVPTEIPRGLGENVISTVMIAVQTITAPHYIDNLHAVGEALGYSQFESTLAHELGHAYARVTGRNSRDEKLADKIGEALLKGLQCDCDS